MTGLSGPESSSLQLDYGLWREEERPESHFLMEEWAILDASRPGNALVAASTERFGKLAAKSTRSLAPDRSSVGRFLVVEAGVHPMDDRWMPAPSAVPIAAAMERTTANGAEVWFRAELDGSGAVDRLTVLDSSEPAIGDAVSAVVTRGLRLLYADERRHRVVVFGVADVSPEGDLTTSEALVVLPQCCCDGVFCI